MLFGQVDDGHKRGVKNYTILINFKIKVKLENM
jgi:hypothetical protein